MTADLVPPPEVESIVARYERMLRSVGRRRGLGDDEIGELIQEVRVRLWRALASEAGRKIQTSYVYRAALSAAIDLIRRRRARREEPLEKRMAVAEPAVEERMQPDAALEHAELGERIQLAVAELAEPRDVVVRLYLSGYGREEIAGLMGWTEPKVRNLLYRGLADLRAKLLAQGIGWEAATT
jgi:RNA polymerase sigma factor (sigma-70 family)